MSTWKTCCLLFVLLGLTGNAVSQKIDTSADIKENGWIEKMNDFVAVKISANNEYETFSVKTTGESFDLYPNSKVLTSIFLNYRMVSLKYSFAPAFLPGNNQDDIKGKTKLQKSALSLNFTHWITQLSYSKTQGYFLNNTSAFDPSWVAGDPYFQIPDLRVTSIEGQTNYNFNQRFSASSLTTQTQRQLKSAGTFVPGLNYRYYIVDDQTKSATTQKSDNFQFILSAGYYYTWVFGKYFYFSAGASAGSGYVFTRLLTRTTSGNVLTNSHSPTWRLDGNTGIGYNGRAFFAGAYLTGGRLRYTQQNTTAVNTDNRLYYQIFVGYRFKAPSFLIRNYDKASEMIYKKH